MFLEDCVNNYDKLPKHAKDSTTYVAYYKYWSEVLFERVMRLFVWENTGEVQPKEIEQRLILTGHCGITKYKNELTAMFGSFHGVTKYIDEWTHYNVHSPVYSANKKIGDDVIIISNNSLRNPTYALIHHYATLLGHIEVTLVNSLINARDAGGVPVVGSEKQKQSVSEYNTKLYNGQFGIVTDIGNLGLDYVGSDKRTAQRVLDIMEVREKTIKSFYSDIGVRSAFEKRNNSITAEVEADTSLLLLNLSDMIKYRELGADAVNKKYGTNWNVHIAEEISYNDENARYTFATDTEIHVKEEVNNDDENSK